MDRRVAIVATYARGDSIRSPRSSAPCRRSSASWTTSSASATLPSIRYAIANAGGSQLLEQRFVRPGAHAAARSSKPSRQLACRGRQPSSRFAFSFDAPRTSVISDRPRLSGERAPARAAHDEVGRRRRAGQHRDPIAALAGSSSTML